MQRSSVGIGKSPNHGHGILRQPREEDLFGVSVIPRLPEFANPDDSDAAIRLGAVAMAIAVRLAYDHRYRRVSHQPEPIVS